MRCNVNILDGTTAAAAGSLFGWLICNQQLRTKTKLNYPVFYEESSSSGQEEHILCCVWIVARSDRKSDECSGCEDNGSENHH